jgi:hypothetical protein
MENTHPDFWQGIGEALVKFTVWMSGVVLGLLGMIGHILSNGRKMSRLQWTGVIMISAFFGIMTRLTCDYHKWEGLSIILPPFTTMFGQYISMYVAQNYTRIFSGMVDLFLKNNTKRNNEQ